MKITQENFTGAKLEVLSMFHKRWALLTAGTPEDFNTMTIGWGSLGTVWNTPTLTAYVRENRYTHEFMQRHKEFTVCFFPESARQDLALLGRLSGRDGDKIAQTGLTPTPVGNTVGFEEAELTFVCKTLYRHRMDRQEVPQIFVDRYYAGDDTIHHLYIAEVVDAFGQVED